MMKVNAVLSKSCSLFNPSILPALGLRIFCRGLIEVNCSDCGMVSLTYNIHPPQIKGGLVQVSRRGKDDIGVVLEKRK